MRDSADLDPQTNIRSDLWFEMTLSELINQQDLVLTKLTTLHNIPGARLNPTVRDIGMGLQLAYDDLTKLIDNRIQ